MSESYDVRLITATYKRPSENELVIEMFGKTREGLSIAIRYSGFMPYFHVFGATEELAEGLRRDKDVVKVEWTDILHKGQVKRSAQVTVRYPGLVPEFRDKIKKIEKRELPLGILDITMYRDDIFKLKTPEVKKTDISFNVNNAVIVLVDDVMYTGRTTRAAIDAIMDLGRPRKIQLAVLVDRGSRELPVHPDYTGITYPTASEVEVFVKLREMDGKDEVLLVASS